MVMGEGHTGPTLMQSVNWSISSDVVQILADSPLPQLLHMPGFRIYSWKREGSNVKL